MLRLRTAWGRKTRPLFFAGELFKDTDLADFKGVLILESDIPTAVVTLRTRQLNFTSLAAVPEPEEGDEEDILYFARIGDGIFGSLGFKTSVILMNNSDNAVSATVEIFGADGLPLELTIDGERASSLNRLVPARCALELNTDGGTDPGVVGWIRVTADAELAGGATFTTTDRETGAFVSEVGVPESLLTPKPSLSARQLGPIATGVALTNPSPFPVTLKLRLIGTRVTSDGADPQGEDPPDTDVVAETRVELGASNHIGLFVSQLFPDVPAVQAGEFEGRVEVESFLTGFTEETLAPVTGITLLTRGTSLTSRPLASYVTNFGPTADFRPATRLAESRSGFCFDLRQLVDDRPAQESLITLDRGRFDFTQLSEAEPLGEMDARALNLLLSANSIVDHVDDDGALFFTPVTFDGVSEAEPLLGTVSNLPGDGVEFRIISNSASNVPFPISSVSEVCVDSGLLQLPAETDQPIRITEQHVSQPDDEGNLLESTRRYLFFLESAPEGPRIDSVDVSRVAGGQQVVVQGAGFSGTVEANQVTVEGNSRIPVTVLEAGPDRLTLQLPDELVSGPLRVQVGGDDSNDYQLQVLFAPRLEIALGGEGPAPAVDLTLAQETGEISLFSLELEASNGQWNTNGFTEGESVGTILLPNPVLGDIELDVVVASSDAESLILNAVDPDDVTRYQIELRNSPRTLLTLTSQEVMSTIAFSRFLLNLRITEDVFVSPQGAIDLSIKLTSAPRRTLFPETSLVIERTQTLP